MDQHFLSHIAMNNLVSTLCYMSDVESYELLYLNALARKMLGIQDKEYLGRKCYEVLQGKSDVCDFCTNKKLVKGEFYTWEYFNPLMQRYFELHDTLIQVDGKDTRLEFCSDITDGKNKLAKLESQLAREETLLKCAQTLSEHKDMGVAINRLLETIGEFYDSDRAYIFEICEDAIHLDNTYEWNRDGIEAQIQNLQRIPIKYVELWFEQFEKEGEFYIASLEDDVRFDSKLYKILKQQGIRNLLVVPLIVNEKTAGFLGVDNAESNLHEASLLRSISFFIANDLNKKDILYAFEQLSYTDIFTGLYSRNKYLQTIEQIRDEKPNSVGIVYLDINGVKHVNNEYGHEYGDKLILKVVGLMKECFLDNIFRIGGDEFVILDIENNRTEFEEKVSSLRDLINDQENVSVSIGTTWCTHTVDIFKQISYADELMYINKQSHYYLDGQLNRRDYKANVAAGLQNSILSNKYIILLQPKISLVNGNVVGAEALVRKKDGQGGLILPNKFISIYESDGIIQYLDFAVMEMACEVLKKWKEDGHPLIPIAVNFSRITILEYKVAEKISNICKKYDIESKYIKIELTESISNISVENLNEILEGIKSFGFKISLDDFGSEYANLSILSNIAFDEIKLDKSLIDDLVCNPAIGTAIYHIVGMCNAFRSVEIVVEGIETYEQLSILRGLDCNLNSGQGYYFSRPLSVENFLQYYLENL